MSKETYWPGQIPELEFNLEQIKAIAPSSRSEVFWAYQSKEPLSVNEVGKLVGKSAQAVRYHTNELLRIGLLLAVETRKRHSRTEDLYVTRAINFYTALPPVSAEYAEEKRRGFQSVWRQFDRDRAATNILENLEPAKGQMSHFRRTTLRLKREDVERFKAMANALIDEFVGLDCEEGTRTTLVTFNCPVFGESDRAYRQLTGRSLHSELKRGASGEEE